MLSIFIGFALESVFGKPGWLSKPLAWFDAFVNNCKDYFTRHYKDSKPAGIFFSLFTIAVVYFCVRFLVLLGLGAVIVYLALSLKSAKDRLKSNDFQQAQTDLEQAIRARIEFIAANTAKDVVGVLFYAFLGGPGLAWAYKTVNAIDIAFAGKGNYYRGASWFNSRLSGILNYLPSRICIPFLWLASRFCRLDAKSSVNAAWNEGRKDDVIPEALFAGALGVQLGGLNYDDGLAKHKPYVGLQVSALSEEHVQNAIKLMFVSAVAFLLTLVIINYFFNVL